jgi:hypothetical protein
MRHPKLCVLHYGRSVAEWAGRAQRAASKASARKGMTNTLSAESLGNLTNSRRYGSHRGQLPVGCRATVHQRYEGESADVEVPAPAPGLLTMRMLWLFEQYYDSGMSCMRARDRLLPS